MEISHLFFHDLHAIYSKWTKETTWWSDGQFYMVYNFHSHAEGPYEQEAPPTRFS